jgi:hypothetical protein
MKNFHWIPRIFSILAILFISIFAADSFAPELTLWQQITGFIMHLVPSFVLLLILIVSWKRELLGGIIFIVLGIIFTPIIFSMNFQNNHSLGISLSVVSVITIPFIIIGVLFLISHFRRKKQLKKES